MSSAVNQLSFRDFERSGWQKASARYHDFFSSLTTQVVPALLDAVLPRSLDRRRIRLLDIATGPGYVAAAAVARGVSAVGVDFSLSMTRMAARSNPAIELCAGDAEQLPLTNESFGAAVTNFGLLHLGRPERAVAEAFRVLGHGGKFGFTVWAMPEEAVAFGIILRAIEAHGNPRVTIPQGPPFFRFSDPHECIRALTEAGFQEPSVIRVPQTWRLSSSDELLEAFLHGSVRTAGLLAGQSAEELEAIRNGMRTATAAYEKNGGIELPMPAVLASAVKK